MVAEEYRMGGTCVIRGCVPKKLLVYASRFAEEFEDAAGYGGTLECTLFGPLTRGATAPPRAGVGSGGVGTQRRAG